MLLVFCVLIYKVGTVRIGSVLLEKRHDHISHGLNLIIRALNDKQLEEFSGCSVEQISILVVPRPDSDLLREKIAKLYSAGIDVVIGPPDEQMCVALETICADYKIRFIKYIFEWHRCDEEPENTYNVFPIEQFTNVLASVLEYWRWDTFTVAVSTNTASCRLHKVLSSLDIIPSVLEIDVSTQEGFMEATNQLRDICDRTSCWDQVNRVIVDMSPAKTLDFLDMSLKLGMINSINWFLLTNLDNLFDDVEPFSHNKMRISLLTPWNTLIDEYMFSPTFPPNAAVFKQLFTDWYQKYPKYWKTPHRDFTFLFDSVLLACRLLKNSSNAADLPGFNGLTGPISFNSIGERANSHINVWELGINGRAINTGSWNSSDDGTSFTMRAREIPWTHEHAMTQIQSMRILKVTTIAERPYVMEKTLPSGQVVYEGFCVDLLDKLAENLNFEYELHVVKDGKYGEPSKNTSEWDGMIGEILRGDADMAVAPITVTALRLEAVDFTDPFLQLGISMLMQQPDKRGAASLTSFLLPLSPRIWIFSLIATVATSLLITFVSALSPREQSFEFTITNSAWYLACILLRAGSGYNCQSVATRMASTIWWSFTLVLIAQYTANFAAVLTVNRKSMPFNSFEEMGNQTDYTFGSILGGSTMQFFKYSRIETFQRIWLRMQNMTPSAFVETNDEGVKRVMREKFVFLMESTSLEYQVAQNCNLTRVGNVVLGSNGYSIALPKGSRWREKLTRQILDFNEKGVMMLLKSHWWKSNEREEMCSSDDGGRFALGMDHIAGLFILLATGLLVGFLASLVEKVFFAFYYTRRCVELLSVVE